MIAFLHPLGKSLKMYKSIFLDSFFKSRNKHRTPLLLLETGSLPIEIMAMERVVEYMLKVQKSLLLKLIRIAWEASKRCNRHVKAAVCILVKCKIYKNVLEDETQHTCFMMHQYSVNEAFLYHQCILTWENCRGSRFTNYTTYVAPSYKTIFFVDQENHTHFNTC